MTKVNNSGKCPMTVFRYAKVLYELGISEELIADAAQTLKESPPLKKVLESPVISNDSKHRIIDRSFPEQMHSFLKVVADHGKSDLLPAIFRVYEEQKNLRAGIVTASLDYAAAPSEDQKKRIENFLCRKYNASGIKWEMHKRPELIGGFILCVNGREYDYSMQGRLKRLEERLTWR